jgi:hypothetical protein
MIRTRQRDDPDDDPADAAGPPLGSMMAPRDARPGLQGGAEDGRHR